MASNASNCPVSPPGYFYRDNCSLLCKPAGWTDVLVFFLGNYVAHVATVNISPGTSTYNWTWQCLIVFLAPGAGILSAFEAIQSRAIFAPTELQMAARARALVMVVPPPPPEADNSDSPSRVPESPGTEPSSPLDVHSGRREQDIEWCLSVSSSRQRGASKWDVPRVHYDLTNCPLGEPDPSIQAQTIHGILQLPKGYSLRVLDERARFENDSEVPFLGGIWRGAIGLLGLSMPSRPWNTSVPCNKNFVTIIVSLFQLGFSLVTLYRARGDQVALYGYAAFGLTVAQYAWMSLLNLMGGLIRPQYSGLFLVESQTLRDLKKKVAEQDKAHEFLLDGTLGKLTAKSENEILGVTRRNVDKITGRYHSGLVVALAAPLAVVGGISHFSPGSSALYQRVWIMMWQLSGYSTFFQFFSLSFFATSGFALARIFIPVMACLLCLCAVSAVGGLVVVGKMIREYGVCVQVS
ncbi:hypothetical protein B0H67DRAFT_547275 [Lasiosphaeris hirsuta]|uniref:Transmembrane protein n=1 Tax=Lasiosphaeris hirsuta TaxID=260670 RepID=A0AA39ZRD8_9PEZI|nr:hypothetical protein B0H67DRAFT_547275 [Lasiosphaeris hirsuta]